MNAFVKKEVRLLLPNAIFCGALGLTNSLFAFNNDGSLQYVWGFLLSFVCCGGLAMMLVLNSFGAEISSGTFSNLLAQPISRQKIWDTKILLLAGTLAAVGGLWVACVHIFASGLRPARTKPRTALTTVRGRRLVRRGDFFRRAVDGAVAAAGGGGILVHGAGAGRAHRHRRRLFRRRI